MRERWRASASYVASPVGSPSEHDPGPAETQSDISISRCVWVSALNVTRNNPLGCEHGWSAGAGHMAFAIGLRRGALPLPFDGGE